MSCSFIAEQKGHLPLRRSSTASSTLRLFKVLTWQIGDLLTGSQSYPATTRLAEVFVDLAAGVGALALLCARRGDLFSWFSGR